jgi:hypothetical protein
MIHRCFLLFGCMLLATVLPGQSARITLTPFLTGLSQPVLLTNAKDGSDRRFIVEQSGRIRVAQPGAATSTLFLDITSRILSGGERGLLGLAFHPQFSTNGLYYLNYTRRPDGATVVAEYRNGVEQRVLFTVLQPYENHNGGMIEFGPDGYLYIGVGDGGAGNDPENHAQNPSDLLGKFLRIDVDSPNSGPEIFAIGFRNPWRFSFDRLTGELYAGDVGQSAREEIDIVRQGGNYGWRVWEGSRCTELGPAPCSSPEFIPPIADYINESPNGRCSIIGGYVYRGTQASLPYGAYIYGDLCTGEIFMLRDGVQTVLMDTTLFISSFGEDESGEIYVVDLNGSVFQITNPDATNTSRLPFATGEGGLFVASTAGSASGVSVLYSRIRPDAGRPLPPGLAIFGFRNNGVLVSEASVSASSRITEGRVFAEISSSVNTGIALVNPTSEAATVSFYFTDAEGVSFGNGTTVIPPNRQIAAFLNEEPFSGRDPLLGTFTFSSSQPVVAVALRGFTNQRGAFLITTLPVFQTSGAAPSGATIAHFADGGGWQTQVVLVNPSDTFVNGSVQFLSTTGQLLQTASYALAPRSATRIAGAGSSSSTQVGSVQVLGPAAVFSILSYRSNGVIVTQTGVPMVVAGANFRMYVENAGTIRSGVAIANPSSSSVRAELEVAGLTASISIPARGQFATFLNEIPEFADLPSPLQTVLQIRASGPVSVTGLRGRTNERGEFLITTTLPAGQPSSESAPELGFPHLPEGGGYSLEFVLFGPVTSGTMDFFDQAGNPAHLLFR